MLRGAEAAALLGDQIAFREDTSQATITLGAYKTNPSGRECTRTLRCSCSRRVTRGGEEEADLGTSACPVHALDRIARRRAGLGLTDKHPLFGGRGSRALTPCAARLAICRACQCDGMTEHSLRRMGAQYYARRGVPLAVIQHIGRWGSATVLKYVDQALEGRASWAPVVAAESLHDGCGERSSSSGDHALGPDTARSLGLGGGLGGLLLGTLCLVPPPGGSSGSVGLGGGRGELDLGVHVPAPLPGGGLGSGGRSYPEPGSRPCCVPGY